MDGKRHVASHDETADETRDDGYQQPGQEGVLDERVAEQVEKLVDHWWAPTGSGKWWGSSMSKPAPLDSPTTTTRPRTLSTSTGAS